MDTKSEIERLAKLVKKRRHKNTFFPSKLDKFKHGILRLKAEGATLEMLQLWLKEQRIEVNISTISRWLKKHGQVQQL
jgi:predicted GNAT family acetyltransferase